MSRSLLGAVAIVLAVVTPALAQDDPPDPRIQAYQAEKARWDADKARSDAANAAADAQFANIQRFAGEGTTKATGDGGQMETAYLSAVSMRSVADAIDQRVGRLLAVDGQNRPITPAPSERVLLLTASDTFTFDRYVAFRAEANGLVDLFNRALDSPAAPMRNCARVEDRGGFVPAVAAIGSIINLFQSNTEVAGFHGMGGADELIDALIETNPSRYVLPATLIQTPETHTQVATLLNRLDTCEQAAAARIRPPARGVGDDQKARLQALLARAVALRDRLMTPAQDGTVPFVTIVRQAVLLEHSRHVLRVDVERSGGTMITRKNIWTALGAPALVFSGGVDATFRLADRTTGFARGGRIMCRTGLTGLRDVMRLRYEDIVCADRLAEGGVGEPVRLEYDGAVFNAAPRPPEMALPPTDPER